jgi:IMP dehydrogenase/GMP reductase
MLGGVLNKTLESCSETKLFKLIPISEKQSKYIWEKFPKMRKYFYKNFRGMSTKEVQKKWGKTKLTTSEGISKYNKVEYTLDGWTENFKDYLKSAMSYTNSRNLEEFKETEFVLITQNALNRYHK